jgi:hypothetical protein
MFKKALFLAVCIPIGGFAVDIDLGIGGDPGYERDADLYYEQDSYGYPPSYQRPYSSDGRYYTDRRFDYRNRDFLRDDDIKRVLTKIIRSYDLKDNGKNLDIVVRNGRVLVRGEVQSPREREKLHRLLDTLESLEFNTQISVGNGREFKKDYRRDVDRNVPPQAMRMHKLHDSAIIADAAESRTSNVSDSELRRRIKDELTNTWFGTFEDVSVDVSPGSLSPRMISRMQKRK